MKREYFKNVLRAAAFLVPIYFVFYPRLHDKQDEPFVKSLWKFTLAGFLFYTVLIAAIYIAK